MNNTAQQANQLHNDSTAQTFRRWNRALLQYYFAQTAGGETPVVLYADRYTLHEAYERHYRSPNRRSENDQLHPQYIQAIDDWCCATLGLTQAEIEQDLLPLGYRFFLYSINRYLRFNNIGCIPTHASALQAHAQQDPEAWLGLLLLTVLPLTEDLGQDIDQALDANGNTYYRWLNLSWGFAGLPTLQGPNLSINYQPITPLWQSLLSWSQTDLNVFKSSLLANIYNHPHVGWPRTHAALTVKQRRQVYDAYTNWALNPERKYSETELWAMLENDPRELAEFVQNEKLPDEVKSQALWRAFGHWRLIKDEWLLRRVGSVGGQPPQGGPTHTGISPSPNQRKPRIDLLLAFNPNGSQIGLVASAMELPEGFAINGQTVHQTGVYSQFIALKSANIGDVTIANAEGYQVYGPKLAKVNWALLLQDLSCNLWIQTTEVPTSGKCCLIHLGNSNATLPASLASVQTETVLDQLSIPAKLWLIYLEAGMLQDLAFSLGYLKAATDESKLGQWIDGIRITQRGAQIQYLHSHPPRLVGHLAQAEGGQAQLLAYNATEDAGLTYQLEAEPINTDDPFARDVPIWRLPADLPPGKYEVLGVQMTSTQKVELLDAPSIPSGYAPKKPNVPQVGESWEIDELRVCTVPKRDLTRIQNNFGQQYYTLGANDAVPAVLPGACTDLAQIDSQVGMLLDWLMLEGSCTKAEFDQTARSLGAAEWIQEDLQEYPYFLANLRGRLHQFGYLHYDDQALQGSCIRALPPTLVLQPSPGSFLRVLLTGTVTRALRFKLLALLPAYAELVRLEVVAVNGSLSHARHPQLLPPAWVLKTLVPYEEGRKLLNKLADELGIDRLPVIPTPNGMETGNLLPLPAALEAKAGMLPPNDWMNLDAIQLTDCGIRPLTDAEAATWRASPKRKAFCPRTFKMVLLAEKPDLPNDGQLRLIEHQYRTYQRQLVLWVGHRGFAVEHAMGRLLVCQHYGINNQYRYDPQAKTLAVPYRLRLPPDWERALALLDVAHFRVEKRNVNLPYLNNNVPVYGNTEARQMNRTYQVYGNIPSLLKDRIQQSLYPNLIFTQQPPPIKPPLPAMPVKPPWH